MRATACAAFSLISSCATSPAWGDDLRVLPTWRGALGAAGRVHAASLAPALAIAALPPGAAVVVVDPNEREPRRLVSEPQRRELRAFVEAGGRLVLFGHAARLVSDLGVEPERPEHRVYRWGFDRRAVQGSAALAMHFVSGREPGLYAGLRGSVTPHSIPIVAGAPCSAPLCAWQEGLPSKGEVLARLGEVRDAEPTPLGPPVLVRWRVGEGAVLACGLLPELEHKDPEVRENARGFVRRCAAWGGGDERELILLGVPARAPAAPRLAFDEESGPPIVPLLAHWGWQAPMTDGAVTRSVTDVVTRALAPSYRQGADVFELSLIDQERGSALTWGPKDPISPPSRWRQQPSRHSWSRGDFRELAVEAHERGMLLLGGIDPLPVGDGWEERLVALRMHARELASARRLGAAAFDGFGLRQWWQDPSGYGVAGVQDYQPAATLYCAGEVTPTLGGAMRAMDADDGALRGFDLAGLAGPWRDGFPADVYPLGVLDARARPEPPARGGVRGGVRGGGSYADWLVAQFHDFVRARRMAGGTALWRRHDPRTLGPRTAAYVQGVSMEPLRAAVAMPLAATGSDGLRAAAAALFDPPPPGFGATVDAPAAAHVLQNNWLRLLGSGGPLAFDPSGLADFGAGSVTLSPGLLRTRLRGGRPDGSEKEMERVDFLRGGRSGGGRHRSVARILASSPAPQRVPRAIGAGAAPQWPAAVDFEWQARAGYHELTLAVRAQRGDSVVAVWLDEVLLRALPCDEAGRAEPVVVPVHVASAGLRTLRLEVTTGGVVALDGAVMERVGDVGVEAQVTVPAGSFAQLVERSTSSHHEERISLSMMADAPGFVVHARCLKASRGLSFERRLNLPGYDEVRRSPSLGGRARGPFVLTSRLAGVPDLCVVPLQLSRDEQLEFAPGEVLWRGAAEAGRSSRVGFLLRPQGTGARLLSALPRILEHLDRPLQVELGPDGRASLSSDLPVACSRLLELDTEATQPLLVRERGFWTWRAVQPAPGGGVWARIHQEPGDVVEVMGGPQVAARTRPGTGALRCVALTDCSPSAATALVLQPSRLRAPSVVMAADFDEVTVDGAPWAYFDGRTVYLPDVPGRYRIETRSFGAVATPHVRVTSAPLRRCAFDPVTKELTLVTRRDEARPAGLPWTAVLGGPVPTEIVNGEVVDSAQLHLPHAAAEAAAERGGVLIRFRPGTTVLTFEQWTAAPAR